jgi:hypothetical protein
LDSFSFIGEALCCHPRLTQFEAHISIDDMAKTGLRRAPRFPIPIPGHMFPSRAVPVEIMVVDNSSDGLGIESPVSLEAGQAIAIASASVFIFAGVRYCRRLGEASFRACCEMHHLFSDLYPRWIRSDRACFIGLVVNGLSRKSLTHRPKPCMSLRASRG